MKKRYFLFWLLFLLIAINMNTKASRVDDDLFQKYQLHGELYFRFEKPGQNILKPLSFILSIDRIDNSSWVYAYANKKQFDEFLSMGLVYEPLVHQSMLVKPKMVDYVDIRQPLDWDFYPTYEAYLNLMAQFATDYPNLCRIVNIGQSVEGRDLLFAVISDNVGQQEAGEPRLMYTSSMHGDEITGYVLSLRLIDYLLSHYASNADIQNLLDHTEIWINPLANPDGTYAGGNSSVQGAIRFNHYLVDLNRNYPDPDDGPHPDGYSYQVETEAFMAIAEEQHFTLSANFHGGSEVFNYPWDTYIELHPDTPWWIYTGRQWADSAQYYGPTGYFDDLDDGITNGYAWYSIAGGRQDYMNYFQHCREVTIEISSVKMIPGSQLPVYWEANYRSLINHLKQGMYGIQGQVMDSVSGAELIASVFVENHDQYNSWVASNLTNAWYYRPIMAGAYDLTFFAPGYTPKTITNVEVLPEEATLLNVQLSPTASGFDETLSPSLFEIGPNPAAKVLWIQYLDTDNPLFNIEVLFANGRPLLQKTVRGEELQDGVPILLENLASGIFFLKIISNGQQHVWKLIRR